MHLEILLGEVANSPNWEIKRVDLSRMNDGDTPYLLQATISMYERLAMHVYSFS